jgi:peroxiredoxin
MDSVATHGISEKNRTIAKNLKARLTELVPGIKAPDFVVKDTSGVNTLSSYRGKYLYIHFIDPESAQNRKDINLLKEINKRYNQNIEFISVYKESDQMENSYLEELNAAQWNAYGLKESNSIWKNYQVTTFPHYVLIDPTGHIVASPALSPTPNGQYETIDKTFFLIQKAIERRGN